MFSGEISGIDLQPRDVALLRGFFESRIMNLAHVSALYFDGKSDMAKKRVQKLKKAGLLREHPDEYPILPYCFSPSRHSGFSARTAT